MEELQYLKELEQILAGHRAFGDSDYIVCRADRRYEDRLDELSAHLPVAGSVQDALAQACPGVARRVLGDTVVRYAINSALRQFAEAPRMSLSVEDCEEVVDQPSTGSRSAFVSNSPAIRRRLSRFSGKSRSIPGAYGSENAAPMCSRVSSAGS